MACKTASMELNRWTKMPTRDRKKEPTEPDIEGDIGYRFEGKKDVCGVWYPPWPAPQHADVPVW